jgi:hypothetical protein
VCNDGATDTHLHSNTTDWTWSFYLHSVEFLETSEYVLAKVSLISQWGNGEVMGSTNGSPSRCSDAVTRGYASLLRRSPLLYLSKLMVSRVRTLGELEGL